MICGANMHHRQETSLKTATSLAAREGSAGIRRRIPNYSTNQQQQKPEPETNAGLPKSVKIFFALTSFLVLVSVGLYASAEHFGENLSRAGHSNSTEKLEIVVANNVLNIQENAIRFPKQRVAGVHNRIELYLHWPTMSGYTDTLSEAFNNASSMEELLFLSVEPRTMSFDMSGRLEPIYSLYFNGLAVQDRSGLVRQPLSENGGFIDEDLYYEPNNPYPFAVRCVREVSAIGVPMCMRDIHIGKDLMITYRFHKRYLQDWAHLDQAIQTYTRKLLANQSIALAN